MSGCIMGRLESRGVALRSRRPRGGRGSFVEKLEVAAGMVREGNVGGGVMER